MLKIHALFICGEMHFKMWTVEKKLDGKVGTINCELWRMDCEVLHVSVKRELLTIIQELGVVNCEVGLLWTLNCKV